MNSEHDNMLIEGTQSCSNHGLLVSIASSSIIGKIARMVKEGEILTVRYDRVGVSFTLNMETCS